MSDYQPGTCNIGRRQRYQRATVACVAGFGAGGIVVAYLVGLLPGALLVAVFVPLAICFEWGLQAYDAFCVRLALLGQYDFRGDGGTVGEIADPESRRADRRRALAISVVSVVAAGTLTLAIVLSL